MENEKNKEAFSDNSPFKYQFEILKMEIETIQNAISRIEDRTHQIKNWTVLIWAGSISLLVSSSTSPFLNFFWLTAIIPMIFWFTEGHFRRRQRIFVFRSKKISEFLNGEGFINSCKKNRLIDFSIYDPRGYQYDDTKELNDFASIKTMWYSKSMRYFYLSLIVVSLLLQTILLVYKWK